MNIKSGSWKRAWGGRLKYFVLLGNKTLCGAKPKAWHNSDEWQRLSRDARCKKCMAVHAGKVRIE